MAIKRRTFLRTIGPLVTALLAPPLLWMTRNTVRRASAAGVPTLPFRRPLQKIKKIPYKALRITDVRRPARWKG